MRLLKISHQLHTDLTPTSTHFLIFIPSRGENLKIGGNDYVFRFGMVLVACYSVALVVCIPFKVKFMKWWGKRQQEKKKEQHGKWGDDE